jgi:glucose/arabinose dehydrogenase
MRQPSRRALLGTTVGLVASAGCLDRTAQPTAPTESATPTESPSPSPPTAADLGTAQSVGGTAVTVSNASVQDSVLYLDTPDSMALATRDDGRYALISGGGSSRPFSEETGLLYVIDLKSRSVVATVTGVGNAPYALALVTR